METIVERKPVEAPGDEGHNCPFYGRYTAAMVHIEQRGKRQAGFVHTMVLVPTHGNQCGLIVRSFAPCEMKIAGKVPDWRVCRVVEINRPQYPLPGFPIPGERV